MNRTERLYKIDRLLNEHKLVPVQMFLDELEVSLATFKRDLEYMRDRLHAPIVWDREAGGYRFDRAQESASYELPGLWFNASEIHALLAMQQLLESVQPGLLTPHIAPLRNRLKMLLERDDMPTTAIERRVRIWTQSGRVYQPEFFAPIATAVLQRKRLLVDHYNRERGETVHREISPQRLNYYRDSWYVDAWCHLRNEIRRFGLDGFNAVWLGSSPAIDVDEKELNEALDSGYGIFGGRQLEWAELRFSPSRTPWVSHEQWHPQQQSKIEEDGSFWLRVPFSDPRELIMDIMRYLPDVQVLRPEKLREAVRQNAVKAVERLAE